jgi:hypothetical protein
MNAMRRRIVRAALALPACAVAAAPAASWPSRPVHLIVVYPPGGVSDAMARTLAEPLAQALGVPVVVENRGGAGGALGMEVLARAAPDGCTLAFSAVSPLTLQPLLAGGPRDLLGHVIPVAGVMNTPVLVAGTPAFTGRSFADLIAQARAHPGELRWATSGIATSGHMVLAQTRLQSGVDITHVPYQGGGPQINDALGGQFEVLSTNVAAAQLQLPSGGRPPEGIGGRRADAARGLAAGADAGGTGVSAGQHRLAVRAVRAGRHAGGGGDAVECGGRSIAGERCRGGAAAGVTQPAGRRDTAGVRAADRGGAAAQSGAGQAVGGIAGLTLQSKANIGVGGDSVPSGFALQTGERTLRARGGKAWK